MWKVLFCWFMDYACRFRRFHFMAIHRHVLSEAERYCICLDMRDQTTISHRSSMGTQTLNAVLGWSQVIAFFYACIFLPFRYVLHTGRFRRGVIFIWVSASAFAFCSVMLGQYLYTYVDKSLVDSCCEGPQFLEFALMGWLTPGMLVSGIAYLLFWRRQRLAKKKENIDLEATA